MAIIIPFQKAVLDPSGLPSGEGVEVDGVEAVEHALFHVGVVLFELSEQQLDLLRKQIERAALKQNVDVWTVWQDNMEFHMLLASFAESRVLNKFLKESLDMQRRIYAQNYWDRANHLDDSVNLAEHESILKALAAGDLDKALECLEKDINITGKGAVHR